MAPAAKKSKSASKSAAKTSDVVQYVSKETGWSVSESRQAVKTVFEGVAKQLKKSDRVSITGVGSFSKQVKPAEKGGKKATNPFTGEAYVTKAKPASKKIKFRAAKGFNEHL